LVSLRELVNSFSFPISGEGADDDEARLKNAILDEACTKVLQVENCIWYVWIVGNCYRRRLVYS
jgi:hypothetical protein